MYNEKLIKLAELTNLIYNYHPVYKIGDVYFYIMDFDEEEYISYTKYLDIFWELELSKDFYEKIINPVKIEILTEKKPKELKNKKKIASIKKDADYKIQVFIDDNYNLYYYDTHAFPSCKTEIIDNQVKSVWNSCKCWFKITGLYMRKDYHISDLLALINKSSVELYPDTTIGENMFWSRLYELMLNEYFKYIEVY